MIEPVRRVGHGAKSCEVFLGERLFDEIPALTAELGRRVAIAGDGFFRIHERRFETLGDSGIETIVVPDGERAKTLSGVENIVTELLARNVRRDSTVVAIGGGVTGDMVGFAAAVFLRGVRLVHVPTTLLAQVDSSIGGKTAVNHPMGKNLIGAFHPATKVISDVSLLQTLARSEMLSGVFEALKSGVIGDPGLFDLCVSKKLAILEARPDVLVEVVKKSIEVKSAIVEEDEREADRRKLLNYGHTIGHGIEAALGYMGLTHGEAVAWGMIGANEVAVERGLLTRQTADRIASAILDYEPAPPGSIDPDEVFGAIRHDKKFSSAEMVMVLPVSIGECRIVAGIGEKEIRAGIDAILRAAR